MELFIGERTENITGEEIQRNTEKGDEHESIISI